jgi:hypothetical protein
MDRFEIYDSRKSLYERALRCVREGNIEKGVQTLELLIYADPANELAKKKLIEIYSTKIRDLAEGDEENETENTFSDGAPFGREPTELEKGEIRFYLAAGTNAIITMLGQSSTGALGAEYSPDTAKTRGRACFEALEERLRQEICDKWGYCEKREHEQFRDEVILATAIGDLIKDTVGEIPPLAIACLLINMGLDEFCGC